jgi:tetratricopeptide (TPR) repeat protein
MSRANAAGVLAGVLWLTGAGLAWARNPHCAGGIQYVVQAMSDKQKGNLEDYQRQMQKAVQQLEVCAQEDTVDYEAIGYLGWAYAEVDSMGPAGSAFTRAIAGLRGKGDKRKLEMVTNNRESFWATAFNKGISEINSAQAIYNPYTKQPENDAEKTQREESRKRYDAAIGSFTRALLLKPADPRTLRNMATTYAYLGEYGTSDHYFNEAIQQAPADTELVELRRQVQKQQADALVQARKFDEAIAYFTRLLGTQPNDGDLLVGLGDAQFSRASTLQGDERKAAFRAAGDAYARAVPLRAGSADVPFNAALAYRQAGEYALSEPLWRKAAEASPQDPVPLDELAAVRVELKRYGDALDAAMKAVALQPEEKDRHLRLGSIYTKAGDNAKSKQALMAYLALKNGTAAGGPGAAAGAAGTRVSEMNGQPEKVYVWEAEGQKYESWFYFSRGLCFHFNDGTQVEKSDWSAAIAQK